MFTLTYFYINENFSKINLVRRMAMCTYLKIPLMFGLIEENQILIPASVLKLLNNTYQVASGKLHCAFV